MDLLSLSTMRILSSITVLLLASPSVALLSSHHEILRQLVEDRGLEVSEECLNATDILREDEDLAVATAAISAQVEEALFSGCQANGSNLNCASDIGTFVEAMAMWVHVHRVGCRLTSCSMTNRGFCFLFLFG